MQKTKLGISVGLFGAILFMAAFTGSYIAIFVAAGYALLAEENVWLKRAAVKALVLTVAFAAIGIIINFIPNVIDTIESLVVMFGGDSFTGDFVGFINDLVNFLDNVVYIAEIVIFVLLAFKALNQGTIIIPAVDKFINKHIG